MHGQSGSGLLQYHDAEFLVGHNDHGSGVADADQLSGMGADLWECPMKRLLIFVLLLVSGVALGATVADYSAGNNPATVVNGPLTFGALGANFSGSQYLDSTMQIKTAALTVSGWFRPDAFNGNQRLVANSHTDADNKGFQLVLNNGGGSGFFDVGNGTAEGRASWAQQLSAGTWYHYAGVYDGATVKAYINGAQVASTAFAGGIIAAGTGPDINVARNPAYAGDFFTGGIYDVQIHGQAYSANQILALFNGTTPPPPITTGIPCDIGPNYPGPVPAPAAAAGFNHCVANYDFTQTSGTFSNVNNFIDICGASSPLLWDRIYTSSHQPCSDYQLVNDSGAGASQVLQVTYTQADKSVGTNSVTFLGTTSGNNDPTPPGVWLKSGWYAEEVMRLTPTTVNSSCSGNPPGSGGCLEVDFWAYPVQGSCNGCPNNLEFDFVEVYTGNDGSGTYVSAGLASGGGSGLFPGIGNTNNGDTSFLTSYNTYASLNTVVNSGSGNNYSGCWILNPQNGNHSWSCVNANISTQSFGTNMEFYLAEVGVQPYAALPYILTDVTQLIQRATIFACGPAQASNPCYTSSLVNY
jgi:hypothetical protein